MKWFVSFFCLLTIDVNPVVAQKIINVDTLSIIRFANFQVIAAQNMSYTDPALISEMATSTPIEFKLLKSKGFVDVLFFNIQSVPRTDTIRNAKDTRFENIIIINPVEQEYIFAFNLVSGNLYRIGGFKESDFDLFLSTFRDIRDPSLGSDSFHSKRKIRRNFYIENVDLGCLYRSVRRPSVHRQPCSKPSRRIY